MNDYGSIPAQLYKTVAAWIWCVGHSLSISALEHSLRFHDPAWYIHLSSFPFRSIANLNIALDTCSKSTLKTLASSDNQKLTSWTLYHSLGTALICCLLAPPLAPSQIWHTGFPESCLMWNAEQLAYNGYDCLVTISQVSRCPALPTQSVLLVMT